MDKRKVLITDGMSHDAMLLITDAPREDLEEWCRQYYKELENGENHYINSLIVNHYVNVLFDSEENDNADDIDVIGYDESYDLSNYIPTPIVQSYFNMRTILYNTLVLLIDETHGQYEDPDEWYKMVFNELDCTEEKLKKIGISITKDGGITLK